MYSKLFLYKKSVLRLFLVFSWFLFSLNVAAQYEHLTKTTYTSFNGVVHNVYLIEGEYTVINILDTLLTDSQLSDVPILNTIVKEIDTYYLGYKNMNGFEPSGGNTNYSNKANVFFGSPSCGAACGILGSKGIEVGGTFLNEIYNELKYHTNKHRLGIVGYEFGRNFFTNGSKILFPFKPNTDERNGGFAEGFANLGQLEVYMGSVYPLFNENRKQFQETNAFHRELKNLLRAYINNKNVNPYNSMHKEKNLFDVNRNPWLISIPSYIASGIMVGTYNLFNKPSMKGFWDALKVRNSPSSVEYALGNIALGFSKAANLNLNNYFINVLKFTIDDDAKNTISQLPEIPNNKLIKDVEELFFTAPEDSLNLNIRSLNYNPLDAEYKYQLVIDGVLVSESQHGDNVLTYTVLNNKESVLAKINLLKNNLIIDSYELLLKKRDRVYYADYANQFHLYSSYGLGSVIYENNVFSIRNITDNFDSPLYDNNILMLFYPIKKNRLLRIKGKVKNHNINSTTNTSEFSYSNALIGGRWGRHGTIRVGYDIGSEDETQFYEVEQTMNTSDYFFSSDETSSYEYLNMALWLQTNSSNGEFKDFYVEDITDSDNDGVTDFNDHCPNTPSGTIVDVNGCEIFQLAQNNYSVEVTSTTCIGSNNGEIVLSATNTNYLYNVSVSGQSTLILDSNNNYSEVLKNLSPGAYDICFYVQDKDNYSQCFSVQVGEPAPLSASSKVDYGSKSISLSMDGSDLYFINLNGNKTKTGFKDITLDLIPGMNYLEISTSLSCQGRYFKEIFVSEEVIAYPNPTDDWVQIYVGGVDKTVMVTLRSFNGSIILNREIEVSNNRIIELDLTSNYPGLYILGLKSKTVQSNLKVIKK